MAYFERGWNVVRKRHKSTDSQKRSKKNWQVWREKKAPKNIENHPFWKNP